LFGQRAGTLPSQSGKSQSPSAQTKARLLEKSFATTLLREICQLMAQFQLIVPKTPASPDGPDCYLRGIEVCFKKSQTKKPRPVKYKQVDLVDGETKIYKMTCVPFSIFSK